MQRIETDVVIIGAGTAGANARRAVEAAGKRWVQVEGAVYGTMCARVGCMPSKLLIAAAERAHDIHHADLFGLRAEVVVDGPAVLERVRRERDRFVGFVLDTQSKLPPERCLFGPARFVGPATVVVGDHSEVHARAAVVATGSTPTIPEIYRGLGDALETNDTIFERPDLPRSLAVIGSGVIGLELGQAMHRLGVRVRILSRSGRLAGLDDPAIHEAARAVLGAELDLLTAEVIAAERTPDGVRLTWHAAGCEQSDVFERVLVATGRHPAVAGLDLARAGVVLDARGQPSFDPLTLQCDAAPVFLAGDVTGLHPVLHEAIDDGRIAGHNAATWPEITTGKRRVPLAITFTDPNIAVVGQRWSGREGELALGAVDYGRQGRARVMGKNAGRVHVYGRASDRRLVGAEMCGPRVEHLAHLVAWAIQSGLTVDDALAMPFYHPVIEEGLRTALEHLRRALG